MLLVRNTHPYRSFTAFDRELDRLAKAFFQAPVYNAPDTNGLPTVNLWESGSEYIAEFDVPGFTMAQLDVSVENGALTVTGKRETASDEKRRALLSERRLDTFSRSFTLPEDVNAEAVAANLSDGVLRITLPKRPETQPRKIEVKGL